MKIKYSIGIISNLFIGFCLLTFTGCEIDERVDDLIGGFEGAVIDKLTGDTVPTEYYGIKLRALDLKYGTVATPIDFNILPDGTFHNTKVYPSKYKLWIEGPFFQQDTIYGEIQKLKKMDMYVRPNMKLLITNVEVKYGVSANITYEYEVFDPNSLEQSVGFIYSRSKYPGQKNALDEGMSAPTSKRIMNAIKERSGSFTQSFNLLPNTTYYVRALGKTSTAGNYWNYSNQIIINTSQIDISTLPITAKPGIMSSTSSILIWDFPPIVDEIKLSYIDAEGSAIVDVFKPTDYSYVSNLPIGSSTTVIAQILYKGTKSPETPIEIKTKPLSDKLIPLESNRPAYIPLFNDINFRYSFSKAFADKFGPERDPGWVNNPGNWKYLDWWSTNLFGNGQQNMPTCAEIEGFTELSLYGGIKTLVDIIHFRNLEKLTILKGLEFSKGDIIDIKVDLSVLTKLKKLKTIVIGVGVPLIIKDFTDAGVNTKEITVIKE